MMYDVTRLEWWAVIIGIAEMGLVILAVIWALTHAAKLPSPSLLVVALVLVILMLLLVFALSSDERAADVLTLVGVPVGALVAASTAVHAKHYVPPEPEPDEAREVVEDPDALLDEGA